MECGGKRSATPLWQGTVNPVRKRRRRSALPAHSKGITTTARLRFTGRGRLWPLFLNEVAEGWTVTRKNGGRNPFPPAFCGDALRVRHPPGAGADLTGRGCARDG